jgi:cell division protein FtsL
VRVPFRRRRATGKPALRAVAPRRPRPPGRVPFFLVSFLVVGGLITAVVSAQAVVYQTSFRMDDLTRRATELQAEHGALKRQLAVLSAPERIAAEARAMGLRPRVDYTVIEVPASAGEHAANVDPSGGGP